MYRLRIPTVRPMVWLWVAIGLLLGACGTTPKVIRDQPVVEEYRLRITKVRNAIDETRSVIAASRGAPYLPELYMRQAELLSEEASYHYMVALEREQGKSESLHVPQVRFLKEQAIGVYRQILERYPRTRLADRILFNISHEQRELGQFEEMKGTLEQLTKDYPTSPYHSEALLVLGDYYFDKSELTLARKYYEKIVDGPSNPLQGLAYYKLAWVHINLTDCKSALKSFENAVASTRAAQDLVSTGEILHSPYHGSAGARAMEPSSAESHRGDSSHEGALSPRQVGPTGTTSNAGDTLEYKGEFAIPPSDEAGILYAGHKSLNVQREAVVDLTYCYAQERKPEEAVGYLKGLAANREIYVAALSRMARRYAFIEQPLGVAQVARELLRLAPDDIERLDDARMLHNVIIRMEDYSSVGEDVELILRAMQRQLLRPDVQTSVADTTRSEFEMLARDLATRSHKDLVEKVKGLASSEHSGKQDMAYSVRRNAAQTARAYEAYLNALPGSPYRSQIVENLADVLMEDHRFLEAGHRYTEAAQLLERMAQAELDAKAERSKERTRHKKKNPSGGKKLQGPPSSKADTSGSTADADAGVGSEGASTSKTNPKARDWEGDRLELVYSAAVAYQKALESDAAQEHFERTVARAGLRRAGGIWLASSNPDPEKARRLKFAIGQSYYDEGRYLEAIALLTAVAYEYPGSKPGDAAVHMVLDSYSTINDIDGLINIGRRFMTSSPLSSRIKSQIAPIVEAAEQRRLDELSLAAAGETPGGMDTLLAFVERYKDSELGERAMLNTFIAARAAGDAAQLYSLGEQILKRFPKSEQAAGVLNTMGRLAAARFEFDRAIDYLERAAALDDQQRADLLVAAGELREQLADREGALDAYKKAIRNAKSDPSRARAVERLSDLVERNGSDEELARTLQPLAKGSDPEVSSRLGLALLRMGRTDEAEQLFRQVVEGSSASSAEAHARANYGMAEIMFGLLEDFELGENLDLIEELIGLADVVLQSYLAAAREPVPAYSQAALARLARAAEVGASLLESFRLPDDLSQKDKELLRQALKNRANQLRAGRDEALAECAQRARTLNRYDEAGLACLQGRPPAEDPTRFVDHSRPRHRAEPKNLEGVRDRLARNSKDLEAQREVARAFLDAGDAHAARLVLARAAEAGGNAEDLNLLGIASYRTGDTLGALEAFGRARSAGSVAATLNMAAVLKDLGQTELSRGLRGEVEAPVTGELLESAVGLGE